MLASSDPVRLSITSHALRDGGKVIWIGMSSSLRGVVLCANRYLQTRARLSLRPDYEQ